VEELLKLSWQTQVALGSGYAAYMLAYVGIREHHKAVDVTFRAIVFGLAASLCLYLKPFNSAVWDSVVGATAALVAGIAWRYLGINSLRRVLRWANVSWADDTPTAWTTISSANSQHQLTQLSILMDDGTWLSCARVGDFNDAPFGPCVLGQTGDIALYVTQETELDKEPREQVTVRDDDYGVRLTYIPAARIKRISMRHLPS
jgi:hypothetical protein